MACFIEIRKKSKSLYEMSKSLEHSFRILNINPGLRKSTQLETRKEFKPFTTKTQIITKEAYFKK
jgi:hypothetical protein